MQRGFLPRWLATFLGVFMALAITFVMLDRVQTRCARPPRRSSRKPASARSGTHPVLVAAASSAPADVRRLHPSRSRRPRAVVEEAAAERRPVQGDEEDGDRAAAEQHRAQEPHDQEVRRHPGLRQGFGERPSTESAATAPPMTTSSGTSKCARGRRSEKSDLFQIRNVKDQLCMDLPDYGAKPAQTGVFEFRCDTARPPTTRLSSTSRTTATTGSATTPATTCAWTSPATAPAAADTPLTIYYCGQHRRPGVGHRPPVLTHKGQGAATFWAAVMPRRLLTGGEVQAIASTG